MTGPAAFDYVFAVPGKTTAQDYLRHAFVAGDGEFGYRNHVVGVLHDDVVAAGAAWSGHSNMRFAAAAVRQILRVYGITTGIGVITRGLRVESIVQPPRRDCCYVAHLGVRPDLRGRGLGESLVRHLLAGGHRHQLAHAALDVAVTNPRAQALYERMGFKVTRELPSRLSNEQATVADHRRMELRLTDAAEAGR